MHAGERLPCKDNELKVKASIQEVLPQLNGRSMARLAERAEYKALETAVHDLLFEAKDVHRNRREAELYGIQHTMGLIFRVLTG